MILVRYIHYGPVLDRELKKLLLLKANNSGTAIVGVAGVRTPQKIQAGVCLTSTILVYLATCNDC